MRNGTSSGGRASEPLNEIRGLEPLVALLGRWEPGDLCCIESLDWDNTIGSLKLVGLFQRPGIGAWPDPTAPMVRVRLVFEGVYALTLRDLNSQVLGFSIDKLSGRQLQSHRFHVTDYEDARIEFFACGIAVLSAETVEPTDD